MSNPYIFNQFLGEEVLRLIAAINAAGLVETLLYGVHLVLFVMCIYLLARSKQTTQLFILGSAVVMFALSTVDVSMTLLVLTHDLAQILDPTNVIQRHTFIKIPLFVTNNFIADLILLYRCYMVWGKSKYILIGATLLVFADSLWGYLGIGDRQSYGLPEEILLPLYVWSIFAINIILTAVTVGRIFWVSKIAMDLTGNRQKGYRTVMAILLESSLVYTACIFAYLLYPQVPSRVIMVTICMRVVAIMPTLLIVQVGLGRAIRENHTTPVSGLDFAGQNQSIVLDTLFTSIRTSVREASIGLRSHPDDEESSTSGELSSDEPKNREKT